MVGATVPDLNEWLSERSLMQDLVRQHLLRAQARMKKQSDKHRSKRTFEIGDWVFLKLQPYAQASVAQRSSQKLAFRFFGPYRVEAKIGNVAYRLALPPSSQIHPVFHVSQLKKSNGNEPVTSEPPSSDVQFQVPEAVLQRRWTSGDHPVEQVLIKWSMMPATLATWEPYEQLRHQFLAHQPGDMLVLNREGMLTLCCQVNHLKNPRCPGPFGRRSLTLLLPAQTGCNRIVLRGQGAKQRGKLWNRILNCSY